MSVVKEALKEVSARLELLGQDYVKAQDHEDFWGDCLMIMEVVQEALTHKGE